MPSVKNPNKPSKNRLAARANKIKKRSQKESAAGRVPAGIVKSDLKRGARPGLMPTSGPRKPVSAKRQRKLDKKLGYALKRKMEAEGEVEMKGESFLNSRHYFRIARYELTDSLAFCRCCYRGCCQEGQGLERRGEDGGGHLVSLCCREGRSTSLQLNQVARTTR